MGTPAGCPRGRGTGTAGAGAGRGAATRGPGSPLGPPAACRVTSAARRGEGSEAGGGLGPRLHPGRRHGARSGGLAEEMYAGWARNESARGSGGEGHGRQERLSLDVKRESGTGGGSERESSTGGGSGRESGTGGGSGRESGDSGAPGVPCRAQLATVHRSGAAGGVPSAAGPAGLLGAASPAADGMPQGTPAAGAGRGGGGTPQGLCPGWREWGGLSPGAAGEEAGGSGRLGRPSEGDVGSGERQGSGGLRGLRRGEGRQEGRGEAARG